MAIVVRRVEGPEGSARSPGSCGGHLICAAAGPDRLMGTARSYPAAARASVLWSCRPLRSLNGTHVRIPAAIPHRLVQPARQRPVDGLRRLVRLGDPAADRLGAGGVRLRQAQSRPVLDRGRRSRPSATPWAACSTTGSGAAPSTRSPGTSRRATSNGSSGSGPRRCSSPSCRWLAIRCAPWPAGCGCRSGGRRPG